MSRDWNEYRKMSHGLYKLGYIPILTEMEENLKNITVNLISKAMSKKVNKLTFLIDSEGGSDSCFNAIKSMMTIAEINFSGLVVGQACSNAFRLLQHCDTRLGIRNATLIFHWGQTQILNGEIAALMDGDTWPIEHILAWRTATLNEVHERTGVNIADLKKFALSERTFMADEALKLNMIDEIIDDLPARVYSELNGHKSLQNEMS